MLFTAVVTEFSLLFLSNRIDISAILIAFTMLSQRLHVLARGLVAFCNLDSGCEGQCFVASDERFLKVGVF